MKREKDLTLKKAPISTHKLYKEFKEMCRKEGLKLKVHAPIAFEIGMEELLKIECDGCGERFNDNEIKIINNEGNYCRKCKPDPMEQADEWEL